MKLENEDSQEGYSEARAFTPDMIHTKFLEKRQHWTAFTTWRGHDLYEVGETEQNAIHFLLTRHADWFSKLSNE